jgi:hypothetical protein
MSAETDELRERQGDPVIDPRVKAMKEMEDALDQGNPEPWQPDQVGDQIIGVFRRLEFGFAKHAGQTPIVIIINPITKEERSVWLLHTALRNKVARLAPQPGEMIAIRYLGPVNPEGGGLAYEGYEVKVGRTSGREVDWSKVGGTALDEQGQWEAEHSRSDADDIPF